jgi:hypothetical protein
MTYFFCKMILPRSDFIQTMTDSERNIMKAHGDYLQSLAEVGSIVCHGPVYPASAVLRTPPPPQGAQPVPHGLPVGHR